MRSTQQEQKLLKPAPAKKKETKQKHKTSTSSSSSSNGLQQLSPTATQERDPTARRSQPRINEEFALESDYNGMDDTVMASYSSKDEKKQETSSNNNSNNENSVSHYNATAKRNSSSSSSSNQQVKRKIEVKAEPASQPSPSKKQRTA